MKTRAVTLMELMIAIVLLMVVILGLYSINAFSHYQVISSSRRARVQNDVTYLMAHMSKELPNTVGNELIWGPDTVLRVGPGAYLSFRVDADSDGTAETWRGYRLAGSVVSWCRDCSTDTCVACRAPAVWETMANNITAFTPDKPSNPLVVNFVNVTVSGCFNAGAGSCGTPDNPDLNMTTRISLPQVSTN